MSYQYFEFSKNANSTNVGMVIRTEYKNCLATIGVCIFRCLDFGWRTFYFKENFMKIKKPLVLILLLSIISLAAITFLTGCGHKHSYVATVTSPTCTEQGYTTYTCECGESYVDNVNALGHDKQQHSAQAATCTEVGWEAYETCTR